jgi:hypothetical protein
MLPQRLLIQKSIFVAQIICGVLVNRKFYEPLHQTTYLFSQKAGVLVQTEYLQG